MIRGLDASSVQGPLPYDKLGPEYRFVILKAQQGNDGFDPWFVRNVRAGMSRGLEVFAYCFAYPLPDAPGKVNRDPLGQAKLFVERTLTACPELEGRPLFLDYEWPAPEEWAKWGCTPKQLSTWMEANAAEVTRLSGRKPAIYTYDWWWAQVRKGADVSWAAEYDLWMAWYTTRWPAPGERPRIPAPWTDWKFWQFDGNNGLKMPNGVDSDFCVFNGDEDALQEWTRGPRPDRPAGDGVLGPAAMTTVCRK